jgi:ADP-ribose pyrophosphatase YjhB (NUDIX family)
MRPFAPAEWADLRRRIPIACVDILPYHRGDRSRPSQLGVGLIERWYPELGWPNARRVWCVLGGRQQVDETIPESIDSQISKTLGVGRAGPIPTEPLTVVEYLPVARRPGDPDDPRQHAIGLLYAVELPREIPRPLPAGSDALDFRWFDAAALPAKAEIGFSLSETVHRCVARLQGRGPDDVRDRVPPDPRSGERG